MFCYHVGITYIPSPDMTKRDKCGMNRIVLKEVNPCVYTYCTRILLFLPLSKQKVLILVVMLMLMIMRFAVFLVFVQKLLGWRKLFKF
jgi:hypothetical protein